MKILFFGTPALTLPFLEWLHDNHTVVGVVCRADEPAGRGLKLATALPKKFALMKGIPCFQPKGPWTSELIENLKDLGADVGVVVAYGRILPRPVFETPKLGSFNIHFSLLPKYRGAAPLQRALINGETETGVSLFWLEEGLDSGPIFHQAPLPITPEDDVFSLQKKSVDLGLKLLARSLEDLSNGRVLKAAQEGDITLAPPLKKEEGLIDWSWDSRNIVNLIRGIVEWPVAQTTYKDKEGRPKRLRIFKATADPIRCAEASPGAILEAGKDKGIAVQTGLGRVFVWQVQPQGGKAMSAWAFWQGARLKLGTVFS